MNMSKTLPPGVAWLGYGGLLPFVALAPASLIDVHHGALWSDALVAYGAVILSFVGALHWAFAMTLPGLDERQRTGRFMWSVVPALLAWPAILLTPVLAAPLLIAGFLAHFWQDTKLAHHAELSGWYLPLRLRLTAVACLCLALGAFARYG
jgi:hypothetical protein